MLTTGLSCWHVHFTHTTRHRLCDSDSNFVFKHQLRLKWRILTEIRRILFFVKARKMAWLYVLLSTLMCQLCWGSAYYYNPTTARAPVAPRPVIHYDDASEAQTPYGYSKSWSSSSSPFTSSSSSSRFHARVAAVMQAPLIAPNRDKGYEHFEGFCVDLLDRMLVDPRQNMTYSIEPAETYGQQIVSSSAESSRRMNHWSGVIGTIARRQADVGTGALTITPDRRRVVDFTVPILTGHLVVVAPVNPVRHARVWSTINSVADLARQNQINYGAIRSGSTVEFFQRGDRGAAVAQMWHHMASRPDLMMPTIEDGIRRVLRSAGDYAFIMESPIAEYEASLRPCELRLIGGEEDNGAADNEIASYKVMYAMATRPNSPLLGKLNRYLIQMHENGYINERYSYWWRRRQHEPVLCESSSADEDMRAIQHRDSVLADAEANQQDEIPLDGMSSAMPTDEAVSNLLHGSGRANVVFMVAIFTVLSKRLFFF